MSRDYIDFLRDILAAAENALDFMEDVSLDAFQSDVEKQYAVTRALEIIGEAARNIPPEMQAQYPHLPWKEMIGMRNIVAHHYFGVNDAVIFRTVREDLPMLDSLK